MKVIHLLVIGLIGFIVYRLTASVQPPSPEAPAPERVTRIEYIQTPGAPATSAPVSYLAPGPMAAPAPGAPAPAASVPAAPAPAAQAISDRSDTETLLRSVLQKLSAAIPNKAADPAAQPGAPADLAPMAPPTIDQLRASQERRLLHLKQRGAPQYYKGIVRRHLDGDTILVASGEVGECIVDEYVKAGVADGSIIVFEAWKIGTKNYTRFDGEVRTALHLIYAAAPLPLWDSYGKPINRDIMPPEAVQKAGLHTETMLDRKR